MAEKNNQSHGPADAMKWSDAMCLIDRLYDEGRYRDSMLIATGCFLGLRISDMLRLRWEDICCGKDDFTWTEKKTGKERSLRLNHNYQKLAERCRIALGSPTSGYIFTGQMNDGKMPVTRQRAAQILKDIQKDYGIMKDRTFSAHSLRKTFGRRVWEQECSKGRGELALMLLSDVFNHSDINITKRYLGIRKDEILSVYDSLEA